MARHSYRYVLGGGLLLGGVLLVRRTLSLKAEAEHVKPSTDAWTPIPEEAGGRAAATGVAGLNRAGPATTPRSVAARSTTTAEPVAAWLPPDEDGEPPKTHPIKAKTASHIYHLPGMANYGRTRPDRCYATAAAAEGDGYVKAKR